MTILAPANYQDILNVSYANPMKLVVVDCKASWRGPCKAIHPFIKNLSQTMQNVIFMEVDVEDEEHAFTVSQFAITAMPTFIYMKGGMVLDKTTGADKNKLVETINKYC